MFYLLSFPLWLFAHHCMQASTCTFSVYLIFLVRGKKRYLKFIKYPGDKEEPY